MCFGRPKPPPLPKPQPVDSAMEPTAQSVTTGSEVEDQATGDPFFNDGTGVLKPYSQGGQKPKPKPTPMGTASLQIPLLSGNLNYPT